MEGLAEWVFSDKKIITSNLLAALSNLSFDEACRMLYDFHKRHKTKLSAFFLVFLKGRKDAKMTIERLHEDELLLYLSSPNYKERILSIKIWAIFDKKRENITIEDVFNAESYEASNKDSQHHKLRSLEPEKRTPIQSQHYIKYSQILPETSGTQVPVVKKSFFRSSSTQSDEAKERLEVSPTKNSFKDLDAVVVLEQNKKRKSANSGLEIDVSMINKKTKKNKQIIEIEEDEQFENHIVLEDDE